MTHRTSAPALVLLLAASLSVPRASSGQTLTLDDAVASALESHPALSAAEARVHAADGAGDAARADRLPGASVNATLTRFQEPMVVAPFHSLDFTDPPVFDQTLVQGRLAMAYTVFDGGVRSSRIRGSDAVYESTRFGRAAVEMSIIEEVAAAYAGVLSARAVLEAAQAQLGALEAERSRAQERFDAGTAAEVEVLRAAATLQDAHAAEASAEARVGLAERGLARSMGVDPAAVEGRPLSDVLAAPMSEPTNANARSPVVLRAERAAEAAEARVSEERAGRLPTLQAGAGLLDFGTLDGDHVVEWQAGLELRWPLFTGGARSAAVRRAEAELAAARGDLDAVRLDVEQAIDAAETAVVEADARADALEIAVAQWEEVARIEALALDTGAGTQADLLRAQAGLFQARAGHARARYDAVLARVRRASAAGVLSAEWIGEALETAP